MDFTIKSYTLLINTLKEAGYSFYSYADICEQNISGRYVVLRHDIDKYPKNALKIAQIEFENNITSTYYFQIKKKLFDTKIIKEIYKLNHEIGYHYNDLVDSHGDLPLAHRLVETNLKKFRSFVPVKTIAMHGSPMSRWDNRAIWEMNDYRKFGIIGEPYFDFLKLENVQYFTDTGRMWNGDRYNIRDRVDNHLKLKKNYKSTLQPKIHNTFDFVKWLKSGNTPDIIMITTHPQRWTDNKLEWFIEFIGQSIKNVIKHFITSFRE